MLRALPPVSDLQVSVRLQHPEAITVGIDWGQFRLWVTQLQIKMCQGQEHKSRERRVKTINNRN